MIIAMQRLPELLQRVSKLERVSEGKADGGQGDGSQRDNTSSAEKIARSK